MTKEQLKTELYAQRRSYLITLVTVLWKAKPEFSVENDSRGSTKEGLIEYILEKFPEDLVYSAMAIVDGVPQPAPVALDAAPVKAIANPLEAALAQTVDIVLKDRVTDDRIKDFIRDEIKAMPPYNININVNQTPVANVQGYVRPEFEEVLERATHRLNILMVGAAGSGKTYIARQVAEALNMPFGSISCSAGMSESHLTGWLIPRGNSGQFEYTQSVFVDRYENGGVFLFDEIDAADSNTLLFINQALANGRFFLPQRYDKPEVVKHPDCIIMAAANTYGTGGNIQYAGRERLDESTLDRFRAGVVPVGYDETLETMLVEKELLKWGRAVRQKINDTRLTRVMSTRFLLDASKLKRSGASMDKIQDIFFHGWREDERKKIAA